MTVEYWVGAERFYEFWFFIIAGLMIISAITLIFIVTYAKKEKRKRMLLIPIGVAALLGIAGFYGHLHYRPYLEQASYINPLVRDRQPRFFGYTYYGSVEETYYHQFNDLDALRSLDLYQEEQTVEPLTYLGEGEHFHYFERANGEIFKQSRQIDFNESAPQAQLIGSRFVLKDDGFQEIGFKNPENTMFIALEVPASEAGKTYEPENDAEIPKIEEAFRRWNF